MDYWGRVGPSRSREGPTHLCFSGCRARVLPDSAGSMGSFSGYPPSMFGGDIGSLAGAYVRIYNCCTISKCIIDMTGGVLEEERRILSMADRGDLANEGSKV